MGSSSPSLQPPIDGESHHRGFRHAAHAREAIRQFLHPDGRRIHVANSPEHAVKLKRRLEQVAAPPDDRFDVYISGSSEHLDAVRQAQTFHEARREALREAHGDVYQQVSNVHSELDVLADEIRRVTTHGVSLDAHFNRFGYSAHIKSYDDWDDSSPSGSATPRPPSLHSEKTGSTQPAIEHSLKFFKMPVVRQYFHKDILWRASGNEEVQSFELFVDLLYVGIIAINGDAAAENPTGTSLLRFVITFTLSWKIWNDTALIISWFETDDIFQRLSIIFLLSCLFGYTTNITQAFETTYPTLIGFYLAARFFMGTYLLGIGYVIPMIRGPMALFGLSVLAGAALWIASIHVAWPNQLILIWLALFIELCAPVLQMGLMQITKRIRSGTTTLYERYFAFQPAINIEHRTERTNAFVTMVFGYTVVAILYQSTVNGIDAFFGKGILGLIQAFCFNWIYFEIDGANLKTHAIRRHRVSALTWSSLHLPFIMSFVLAGGALSRLVVAHDTPDAFTSQLTDEYGARSEEEIASGIRWFYCTGLGLALACMGGISWTHVHREIEGLRLRKMWRLVVRFGVAITLVCLSLADHLDSTELVATATCLTVLVLSTELWFGSSCLEALCSRSQPCRYVGQCGRQKMEELVRGQSDLSLSNLAEKRRRADGAALTPI